MSLSQLQTAAARLVRFPEEGRDSSWNGFVPQFDLTVRERLMLHHVAHNMQVLKYGKKLRYFRFSDTIESLPNLEVILGTALFEKLWFDYFEPQAGEAATEELTVKFLAFLRTDCHAQALLAKEAPPYAKDFIHFLYYENSFEQQGDSWRQRKLPTGTLLAHGAVCPLQMEYDVPQLMQKIADEAFDPQGVARKTVYYVLALKDGALSPSLFSVDHEVYRFLSSQLTDPHKSIGHPMVYNNLVKAGICIPDSSRGREMIGQNSEDSA